MCLATRWWTAGAVSYDIQVDDNADFTSPVEANGVTETQVELTGLTDGVTVFWRVRAS